MFYLSIKVQGAIVQEELLYSYRSTSKPKFDCEHLKHGDELWKSVFWSDETKLELFGNMDAALVW